MNIWDAVSRGLLACYPPSFRERYGSEMHALLDDSNVGAKAALSLVGGSARAWLRGTVGDPVRRTQGCIASCWVCFVVVFVALFVAGRRAFDPGAVPVPESATTPQLIMDVSVAAVLVLLLLGGLPLFVAIVRFARSDAGRRVRHAPFIVAAIAFVTLGFVIAMALWFADITLSTPSATPAQMIVDVCLVVGIALLGALTVVPAYATSTSRLPTRVIRWVSWLTLPFAVLLSTITACVIAQVARVYGTPYGVGALWSPHTPGVATLIALGLAAVASIAAMTSSIRGITRSHLHCGTYRH